MKFSSLNKKIFRDLFKIKGQCFAIATVIACGISLLIASFSTITTLETSMNTFYNLSRFGDIFATVKHAPNHLLRQIRNIPGVSTVEARIGIYSVLDIPGLKEPAAGIILSIPEHTSPVLNIPILLSGKYPAEESLNEITISESFAKAHNFQLGDHFHAIINSKKRQLLIVGIALSPEFVYALSPGALMPDDKRFGAMWMSYRSLAAAYNKEGAFNNLTLKVHQGSQPREIMRKLDQTLKPYGGSNANQRKDQISHFFLSNELTQLRTTGTIIPPIFLMIAAFLLNIIISRLVTIDREQIGLLKSFGYNKYDIGWLYIKLVMVIILVGLSLGIILGLWLSDVMIYAYGQYFKFPTSVKTINQSVIIISGLITFAFGAVGSVGAVISAMSLAPAIAMKPPSPTPYRSNYLSVLINNLQISQPSRMIFRHLIRFPLRGTLTVIGSSMSVAIMIIALFLLDSIEAVVESYFSHQNRQDITIWFNEASSSNIENSIKKLPGVLQTQFVSSASVTIKNRGIAVQTSLVGRSMDTELSRLHDGQQPTLEPIKGVILSQNLAKELNVKAGDNVILEAKENPNAIVEVPVIKVIQLYLGKGAFMHVDQIAQFFGRRKTANAVHTLIDNKYSNELYDILKSIPAVSGVILQNTIRESFKNTIDNTIGTAISFYVVLASLISFGVSYNTARIALSERTRALASLRVMGFTNQEVAYILMGELGCLMLLSLPVGCILGYLIALSLTPLLETELYSFPFTIDYSTYGVALIVTAIASAFCMLIIRKQVFDLDLISALKARE